MRELGFVAFLLRLQRLTARQSSARSMSFLSTVVSNTRVELRTCCDRASQLNLNSLKYNKLKASCHELGQVSKSQAHCAEPHPAPLAFLKQGQAAQPPSAASKCSSDPGLCSHHNHALVRLTIRVAEKCFHNGCLHSTGLR